VPYIPHFLLNLFAGSSSPALVEPELDVDVWADEGLEYFRERFADEHSGFHNRYLLELKIVHEESAVTS